MKVYKDLPQGSEEWLKIRLGKFGGTDAQAVATNGKGLETKCYEKVGEIITSRSKDNYTNADMERGNELESQAIFAYEMLKGVKVERVGYIELNDRVGVSPDGFVEDDGLVEVKCPTDANFIRFLVTKKPDTKYIWQMQHQMLVTGRKWVDFVVFNDNLNRIEIERVERDEKAISKIKTGLESGEKIIKDILEKIK
jgi:putative phage-type endonuclease